MEHSLLAIIGYICSGIGVFQIIVFQRGFAIEMILKEIEWGVKYGS